MIKLIELSNHAKNGGCLSIATGNGGLSQLKRLFSVFFFLIYKTFLNKGAKNADATLNFKFKITPVSGHGSYSSSSVLLFLQLKSA